MKRNFVLFLIALYVGLPSIILAADPGLSLLNSRGGHAGESYSLSTQVLLFMGVLIMLPAGLMMMTSFVRVIAALTMFRQAQDKVASGSRFVGRLKEVFVKQLKGKHPESGSRERNE